MLLRFLRFALYAAFIAWPFTSAAQYYAPFEGIWEYRTDSICFRLQLQASPDLRLPDGTVSQEPVLMGRYSFSRGNVVVEETFSAARAGYPFAVLHLGYQTWGEVIFRDQTGQTTFSAALFPSGYSHPELSWTRQRWLEPLQSAATQPARLALPDTFTLTRINQSGASGAPLAPGRRQRVRPTRSGATRSR